MQSYIKLVLKTIKNMIKFVIGIRCPYHGNELLSRQCFPKVDTMNKRFVSSSGQVIVEFTLILPVLLVIVASIIELGLLFYNKQVIANASREGARAGIVRIYDEHGTKIVPDIKGTVEDYCRDRLITFGTADLPSVTPATPTGLNYPQDLTVKVSYEYSFIFSSIMNLFGAKVGPTIEIAATTVMRME